MLQHRTAHAGAESCGADKGSSTVATSSTKPSCLIIYQASYLKSFFASSLNLMVVMLHAQRAGFSTFPHEVECASITGAGRAWAGRKGKQSLVTICDRCLSWGMEKWPTSSTASLLLKTANDHHNKLPSTNSIFKKKSKCPGKDFAGNGTPCVKFKKWLGCQISGNNSVIMSVVQELLLNRMK